MAEGKRTREQHEGSARVLPVVEVAVLRWMLLSQTRVEIRLQW